MEFEEVFRVPLARNVDLREAQEIGREWEGSDGEKAILVDIRNAGTGRFDVDAVAMRRPTAGSDYQQVSRFTLAENVGLQEARRIKREWEGDDGERLLSIDIKATTPGRFDVEATVFRRKP